MFRIFWMCFKNDTKMISCKEFSRIYPNKTLVNTDSKYKLPITENNFVPLDFLKAWFLLNLGFIIIFIFVK